MPISFQPAATGTVYGTLTLTDNNLNAAAPAYATQTIALSGAAPVATISATMLAFGPQQVQTASAPQQVTLTNTGSATLTIIEYHRGRDEFFCVRLSESLRREVWRRERIARSRGTLRLRARAQWRRRLSIADNASGSPQIVFLNGMGVYPVTVAVTPSAST